MVELDFATRLAGELGPERLIAAVDGKGGRVAVHGWRTALDITPAEAVFALEPFFGEFLYTHVDLEGLMRGTDMEAIAALRAIRQRRRADHRDCRAPRRDIACVDGGRRDHHS